MIKRLVIASFVCLLLLGGLIWEALERFPHNPPEPPSYTQQPLPSADTAASITVKLVAAYHGSGGEAVEPTTGSAGAGNIAYGLYLLGIKAKQNVKITNIHVVVEGQVSNKIKGPIEGPVTLDMPSLVSSWDLEMDGNALDKSFSLQVPGGHVISKGSTATYGILVRSDVSKEVSSISVEVDVTTSNGTSHKLAASGPGLYILVLTG